MNPFPVTMGQKKMRALLAILAFGLCGCLALHAQLEEYRVKAYFLYNFTKYVGWPADAFRSPTDPIVICILGQDPFDGALEEAARGNLVERRALAIRPVSGSPPGSGCHVLFVAAAERKNLPPLAATLRGLPVLIVGESEGLASHGAVVNFKVEDGKVRFEINPAAAAQAHVRISSKLLSLAQIVGN